MGHRRQGNVIRGFWETVEDIIRRTESGEIKLSKSVVSDGVLYLYSCLGFYTAYRPKDKAYWRTEKTERSQYGYMLMPIVPSTGYIPCLALYLEYISEFGEPS